MKKQLSCLLAVTMAASMAAPAFAQGVGKQTVSGDNEVNNALYNYQIPMTLDFAIDPFEKGGATQVFSGTFPLINKSDVPLSIKVSAKVTPKGGANVDLKETAAEVTQTAGYTNKEIYVEAVAAKTVALTETGTASNPHVDYGAPTVTHQANTPTVTFTPGGGAGSSTKTSIAIALTGYTATAAADASNKGAFTIVVKDGDGNELFVVDSGEIADITAADALGSTLVGKQGVLTLGGKTIELTGASGGADAGVTFEAADDTAFGTGVDASSWTFEIVPERGTSPSYELDTAAASAPTYPAFNDAAADAAIKDGANTKAKAVLGEAEKDSIWFVLDKAEYQANFKDGPKETLKAVTAANSAAGFRLMGAATPGAPWAKDDVKVTATFDVAGVTPTSIAGDKITAITGIQRVYEQPATVTAPSSPLNLATVYGSGYTTTYDLDVYMGTQMSKISKVEFRPAGTLKTATTWTAWASPANYSYDAATGKIKLAVTAQKLMKDPTSNTTAQGGIANTFKADTMEATNQIRVTFASDETGVEPQVVIIEVPLA